MRKAKATTEKFIVGETVECVRSRFTYWKDRYIQVRVVAVRGSEVTVVDAKGAQQKFTARVSDGRFVAPRQQNVPSMPDYLYKAS